MLQTHCVIFVIVLVFNSKSIYAFNTKIKNECGYKQCPQTRDGALNVHIIPHSHMDIGWVKTFDEYFYGTRTSISTANVQLIFHSVVSELLHDKRRKFTFAETAYFWRWWKEQRPTTRATFKTLVQEGRLEFAGGGWVENDEAVVDYAMIIDQYTWGLRKLNDTLGPCGKPKAAWQIDTYGHSKEHTSLLAQMGFDGLFIGRVDQKQRDFMIDEDRLEFMWRGSDVLGKMSDIMTHLLFNLYNAPEGFCFDFLCNDEPIMDDPDSALYNADKRVSDFIAHIERQAKYYAHDNIMVTMGGDFTYQSAANWFMNIDKLINHVNTHPANLSDINIFYSTPSCFLKAIYLYGKRDKTLYTERGDHIPYGSDQKTYWTGYYTSRPSLKFIVKKAHAFLQVVKQITVISRTSDSYELHMLRNAVNLALHHDAVTGTSQQHVANDYIRTIFDAVDLCTKKVSSLLSSLTPTWGGGHRPKNYQQFVVCHQLNISQCRFSETHETLLLLVYNPSTLKTYHYIKLPAMASNYLIKDANDEDVEYQMVSLPPAAINIPGRKSTAIQELYFEAENIPPLGYASYYLQAISDPLRDTQYSKTPTLDADRDLSPTISNEYLKVNINSSTGLLESIQHIDGVKILLSQNFFYYSQMQSQQQHSGAYSFRPDSNTPTPVTEKVLYHTVKGNLIKEIRQRFSDWLSQTIRLYRGEEFIEFEWIIGPVPIGQDMGKEVVTKFYTNITNGGEFYTDSNGRQMLKRSCWNETSNVPEKKRISACYHPVTSRICIRSFNSSIEMCVLNDRAQGGTSYNDGEIELMLHRRLLTDDGFGLEESLNEEAHNVGLVIKGKHRIVFGNIKMEMDDLSFSERTAAAARRWQYEPWVFLTGGDKISRRKWQNMRNKKYSPLRLNGLPKHIHILTLEPWKAGSVLLRLENTLTKHWKGESEFSDSVRSSHITVDLRKVFLQMQIKTVKETTLGGNQWLEEARQMDWSTRYVYTGSTDGILPEDNMDYIVDDSQSSREKETGATVAEKEFDEDSYDEQRRMKSPSKPTKLRYNFRPRIHEEKYENRRKRSINESSDNKQYMNESSEHEVENTSNETIRELITTALETTTEELELSKAYTLYVTNVTLQPFITTQATASMNTQMKLKQSDIEYIISTTAQPERSKTTKITRKPHKLKFLNKKSSVLTTRGSDTWTSEEMLSSEEETKLRKRSSARKRHNDRRREWPPELVSDGEDGDDITRSIYEMYYKTKSRRHGNFKPMIRDLQDDSYEEEDSFETTTKKPRRKGRKVRNDVPENKNIDDSIESMPQDTVPKPKAKKKSKRLAVSMPFFMSTDRTKYFKKKKKKRARVNDEKSQDKLNARNLDNAETFAPEIETTTYTDINDRSEDMELQDDSSHTGYKEIHENSDGPDEDKWNYPRGLRDQTWTYYGRRKRSVPKEDMGEQVSDSGEPEIDYLITLRPTQIRTFIVWFEPVKKTFTL